MDERLYNHHLVSASRSFGHRPSFCDGDHLPGSGYSSLYGVTEGAARAITEEGTAAGFKGVVWAERLWLDIDSYEAAQGVEEKLVAMKLDFVAYDSGGKGAHFGILRSHPPSHLLPQKDREWARRNFPECDTSLYTHLHLLRLPGAVHESTGRKKELVSSHPGQALILPPLERKTVNVTRVAPASSLPSVFTMRRVMFASMPVPPGRRHEQLVKLAFALRDDARVSADLALWWCLEVNKQFSEPKNESEVEHIVGSVYGDAASVAQERAP